MIPYLTTYTTFASLPTGHLRSHKVVALPGPRSGHRRPQLTSIPTKYPEPTPAPTKLPQQTSASGQISSTGIRPGPIISSRRRRSRSGAVIGPTRSDPRPNISNRRQGSNDLGQVANTSLARRRDYSRLCPADTAVPRIVSNRHRDSMNYRQPTPGISNPAPRPPRSRLKHSLSVVLRRARRRLFSIFMVD